MFETLGALLATSTLAVIAHVVLAGGAVGGVVFALARHRAGTHRGLNSPRLFDLLIRILTRGRDDAYRADLLDLAGIAAGQHVLDIGCGTGTQAIATWRRVQPGGTVVGIDISPNMLAAARRKARRAGLEIDFREADAAQLPFESDRFDVVTITTVMHMIPDEQQRICLREAARVLHGGGRLLVIDYAGDVTARRHWSAKHGRHGSFDLATLRPALSQEGFEEIEAGPLSWLSLHFLRARKS
jgi:ubiquinone/menaquinone biosynthesis C-methylase UbiE